MNSILARLPIPRPGQVLGLVGTNGIGKSTALKILAGNLKVRSAHPHLFQRLFSVLTWTAAAAVSFFQPNLGRWNSPPDWQEILAYFRGSELQNYFTKILEDHLKVSTPPPPPPTGGAYFGGGDGRP